MPSLICSSASWIAFVAGLLGVVFRIIPVDSTSLVGLAIFFILAMLSGLTHYSLHHHVSKQDRDKPSNGGGPRIL